MLKKIIKDEGAQISLELLLILGMAIMGALLVGFYLKQSSINQANKAVEFQTKSMTE